jgi:hypothetical protein
MGRSKSGPTVQPKSTTAEADANRKPEIRLAARTFNALCYRLVYSLISQLLAMTDHSEARNVAVAIEQTLETSQFPFFCQGCMVQHETVWDGPHEKLCEASRSTRRT